MDTRAGLEDIEELKFLTLTELELEPFVLTTLHVISEKPAAMSWVGCT
jgi:hypothetical protein